MSFQPQPGFSAFRVGGGFDSQHIVLGPLAKGDVVRRAVVHVHAVGVVTWRWGASLGVSAQGTFEGLHAGRSFVTKSTLDALNGDQGFPHIGSTTAAEIFLRFEFFPGMMVSGASGWIQVHTLNFGGGNVFITSTFEITRFVKADGTPSSAP